MITVCAAGSPKRRLFFQGPNYRIVIGHLNVLIERAQAGGMRKQLREGDIHLAALRKLRPEFRNAAINFDFVFLKRVEQTCAADSFRGRPDQHDRVLGPGLLPLGIAKSTVQIEQRLAVLPDRDRRAQFAKALEILLEQWRDAFA